MEKLRIISLLWTLLLLNILKSIEAEEQNGYIFTCPRSLKTGATNQLFLRRFGENLAAGKLNVKVSYTEGYQSNETTALEKSYEIEEGKVDTVLPLFLENFQDYVYSGKITINGTFGDREITGSDKVQFNTAKDFIALIQTDKPLYKDGQTVKFRVMRLNKDLKPAVQDNFDAWIEDPQGTRLFQWKDVSLGKGIKQFEFPLANEPVKGDWKIVASFKGDITTTTFEVKEYVPPKFEVTIKIPPFVLANAEEIPITICAKYTYGKNVRGTFHLKSSLENYSWANEKLPTLEHSGKIDGCIDYIINVSLVETEDFYRYRRIQIKAGVEEDGTGVQRNASNYIQRQYTPLTLSFNRDQRQFYKPGLPYNGKLFVKNPDNSEAAGQPMEICYTVTKERVVMDGKWKATRTVKFCQNYTSDESGEIQFVIPRQNTDSVEIGVSAKSLLYTKDKSKMGVSPRQSSLSQPQTSMTLTPWYSPSGSFIQLQPLQETLLCGTTRKVKVLFTSKEDANYKFFYQVIHQGEIVKSGSIEKSFSVSDDVSSKYEDDDKVIDDSEVQIVPAIDSSQLPESTEEECKSAKEARYIPPIGEVDIELDIDSFISPSFHMLVYYIRDDKETIADSQKLSVEKCFKNQVKLQFGDEVKQPGTKTSIRVTSSPNSLCGIKVIDKSITLLDSSEQLTAGRIFSILESFDGGLYYGVNHCNEEVRQPGLYKASDIMIPQPWSSSSYEDSMAAFENAGFIVISDLILFSRPCKSRGGGNIVYDEYAVDGNVVRGGAAVAMASVGRRPPASAGMAAKPMAAGAESATKSVVDVRNYFPDTWLFELEMTGDDGVYITKEKLPHTITEWVGSAVCINDEDGIGLSNTTTIKGFQAFFISINLPYSVVRGETATIPVLIFSYVDDALPVTVSVDGLDGFEVDGDGIDGDYCIQPGQSLNLKLPLKAASLGKQNITIRAESAQSSDVCGSSEVSDALAKDAITSSLIVEAEGWPEEKVESVLFCLKEGENEVYKKTFTASLKEDIVPDSSRCYIDVSGSLLGKSMDNLENLVQLPTGCGEQNMVKFAPNVVVLDFLTKSKKLTPELEKRIIRNMNTGAQRQSKYRHSDGSYSAFGHRDKEGSMFLTAFVLRYFSQASKYITIDSTTIEQMQNWIASKQQADGCFPDIGKIIDRGIEGGLKKDKSNGTITAYVLASLLTSGYENQTVLDQAFSCITSDKDNTIYATVLYAYAEALAGKTDEAKERIDSLKDKSIKEGGTVYYHDVNATKSQDIETSAYYVAASLKSGFTASEVLLVVQYLMKNMNPRGGFVSTQDTVVTLDALSKFALETFKDPVDITLKTTGGLEQEIQITEDDKLLSKRYKVDEVPSEVSAEASGSGCAVIQSILRYNSPTPPEKRSFDLDVAGKCLDDDCKRGSISVSISYIPEDKTTGMALIEVKMISGWSPERESLEALMDDKTLKLMRYDVENNNVVFYFEQLSNKEKDFIFTVEKVVEVDNSQPGTAKAYDYYDRDISSSASYTLGNCEDSSSCPTEP